MDPKKTDTLKPVAPKILQQSADWYSSIFPSLNAGCTFVLDGFPAFYRQSLAETRGKFSSGELGMVIDVLNGHGIVLTAMSPAAELVGQHLWLSLADSFQLYPGVYEEKWDITNPESFLKRIDELPRFSKACLEIWAAGFWERHDTIDFNEYVGALL